MALFTISFLPVAHYTQLRKIHFDGCFFFQRADFIIAFLYFTYIDLLFHIFIIAFIYLYLIDVLSDHLSMWQRCCLRCALVPFAPTLCGLCRFSHNNYGRGNQQVGQIFFIGNASLLNSPCGHLPHFDGAVSRCGQYIVSGGHKGHRRDIVIVTMHGFDTLVALLEIPQFDGQVRAAGSCKKDRNISWL